MKLELQNYLDDKFSKKSLLNSPVTPKSRLLNNKIDTLLEYKAKDINKVKDLVIREKNYKKKELIFDILSSDEINIKSYNNNYVKMKFDEKNKERKPLYGKLLKNNKSNGNDRKLNFKSIQKYSEISLSKTNSICSKIGSFIKNEIMNDVFKQYNYNNNNSIDPTLTKSEQTMKDISNIISNMNSNNPKSNRFRNQSKSKSCLINASSYNSNVKIEQKVKNNLNLYEETNLKYHNYTSESLEDKMFKLKQNNNNFYHNSKVIRQLLNKRFY